MSEFIPKPTIIMFGCQSLSAMPHTPATCPVCKGGIKRGHDTRYCGVCDSLSPAIEGKVKAARLNGNVRERADVAGREFSARLLKAATTTLTESERRRIWNGHGRISSPEAEPVNRAKAGREWLAQIDQMPDWSLVRDGGRWVHPDRPIVALDPDPHWVLGR